MPYDTAAVVSTFNAYYKTVLFPTVKTIYRTSTPTLSLFNVGNTVRVEGSLEDSSVGGGSHITEMYNNSYQIDVESAPIFAQATSETARINSGLPVIESFTIPCKNLFNAVMYTEKSLKTTAKKLGSIESAADSFQRNLVNGWKLTMGRQILATRQSNGTGILAYTSGSGTGSTNTISVTLDNDRSGARYLAPNQYIYIAGATGGLSAPGNGAVTKILSISGYGGLTQTITVADYLTYSSAAIISGVSPDGSLVDEINGLGNLIAATGTVQGIDITTFAWGQSHVYSTSGNFSGNIAMNLFEQCQTGKPRYWIMNQLVWAAARNSVITDQRTGMGESGLLDIGYPTLSAMGGEVKMILDYDCPYGLIYMVYIDGFSMGILDDLHYIGLDPIVNIPGTALFETKMGWYGALGQSNFEANALYSNITA